MDNQQMETSHCNQDRWSMLTSRYTNEYLFLLVLVVPMVICYVKSTVLCDFIICCIVVNLLILYLFSWDKNTYENPVV